MSKESENTIRELFNSYFNADRLLKTNTFTKCKMKELQRIKESSKNGLAEMGVDKIVSVNRNGKEVEEVVIFESKKHNRQRGS